MDSSSTDLDARGSMSGSGSVWAYGRMGVWAYGRMGVWAYGRVSVWACERVNRIGAAPCGRIELVGPDP